MRSHSSRIEARSRATSMTTVMRDFGCPNEDLHTHPDAADRAFVVWPATRGKASIYSAITRVARHSRASATGRCSWTPSASGRGISHARELMEWCPGHEWEVGEQREAAVGQDKHVDQARQ